MAGSLSLKAISIFEVGSKLNSGDEMIGLAAYLYHRFFRTQEDMSQFDLYTISAACIKLAYQFYEKDVKLSKLCIAMASIVHGPNYILKDKNLEKLEHSVALATKIIAFNLNHEINYRDNRLITPGILRSSAGNDSHVEIDILAHLYPREEEEKINFDEFQPDVAEISLVRNSKYKISPHRYLLHYLKTIKLFVEPPSEKDFKLVCNLAWIILSDLFWSPFVIKVTRDHLACACFMMAVEACRPKLDVRNREKKNLWTLLNKKWHLILCEDLNTKRLRAIVHQLIEQFEEYERLLENEITLK